MARLIDTDELLGRVERAIKNSNRDRGYLILGSFVKEMLANCPTVDAEPVRHGHWIEAHDNDGLDYECSNRKCQCRISYNGAKVSGDFNYCPNCGAKMDEVSE